MKVLLRDETGKKGNAPKVVRAAAKRVLSAAGCEKGRELSVLLAGAERIRALNREYRGKDKPTDVLSFPLKDPALLGDIVISTEVAELQAGEFGVSVEEELCRLTVHGILHLLGYDHVRGGAEARRMKSKEEELMILLGGEGHF